MVFERSSFNNSSESDWQSEPSKSAISWSWSIKIRKDCDKDAICSSVKSGKYSFNNFWSRCISSLARAKAEEREASFSPYCVWIRLRIKSWFSWNACNFSIMRSFNCKCLLLWAVGKKLNTNISVYSVPTRLIRPTRCMILVGFQGKS